MRKSRFTEEHIVAILFHALRRALIEGSHGG